MLRLERRSIWWMINLVAKSSSPGYLKVYICGRTMAAAKHVWFCLSTGVFGCENDVGCIRVALPALVKVYTRHGSGSEGELSGNGGICVTAWEFFQEMDRREARRKEGIWSVSIGLLPVQSFLQHVLNFILSYRHDLFLFQRCRHIPLLRWSFVWRSSLLEVDEKALLSLECRVAGVFVILSPVDHSHAGLGVFPPVKYWMAKLVRRTMARSQILIILSTQIRWKTVATRLPKFRYADIIDAQ